MGVQKNPREITAIVVAFNEAARICAVLDVLTTYPGFREIIVVDDGSTDDTGAVVQRYPVRYLRQSNNQGKAQALDRGVAEAMTEYLFFCDADVRGLTHRAIERIIAPVMNDEVALCIGMRNRRIYWLSYLLTITPLLGGERALTRRLWQMLPAYYKVRFRVEAGLNFYAVHYDSGFTFTLLPGVTQAVKEKKYGWGEGLRRRGAMIIDVVAAQLRLQIFDAPKNGRGKQLLVVSMLWSLAAIAFGVALLIAARFGPQVVIARVFAETLRENPAAPFVHWLITTTSTAGSNGLAAIGAVLLVVNLIIFLLNGRNLITSLAWRSKQAKAGSSSK